MLAMALTRIFEASCCLGRYRSSEGRPAQLGGVEEAQALGVASFQ